MTYEPLDDLRDQSSEVDERISSLGEQLETLEKKLDAVEEALGEDLSDEVREAIEERQSVLDATQKELVKVLDLILQEARDAYEMADNLNIRNEGDANKVAQLADTGIDVKSVWSEITDRRGQLSHLLMDYGALVRRGETLREQHKRV